MAGRIISGWLSRSTQDMDFLLPVPFDYQPEEEDECLVYCLWMVNHFFKNKHPNSELRSETRALSPDEIKDDISIVKGGWRPDQDELTIISEKTRTLKFSLNYWQDGAPKDLREILEENIPENRPVIPFINGGMLRDKNGENDGVHAIVAAGYNDDSVAIHDPWGYPEDYIVDTKLEEVWDPMFNQVITTTLSNKGTKVVGGEE